MAAVELLRRQVYNDCLLRVRRPYWVNSYTCQP